MLFQPGVQKQRALGMHTKVSTVLPAAGMGQEAQDKRHDCKVALTKQAAAKALT